MVDEIGYLPINHTGVVPFFQLMNRRYERASTVLTSNKIVRDEVARLKDVWSVPNTDVLEGLLKSGDLAALDAFDRLQLESVVSVCRRSRSLVDAGGAALGASRLMTQTSSGSTSNDLDFAGMISRAEIRARMGELPGRIPSVSG